MIVKAAELHIGDEVDCLSETHPYVARQRARIVYLEPGEITLRVKSKSVRQPVIWLRFDSNQSRKFRVTPETRFVRTRSVR